MTIEYDATDDECRRPPLSWKLSVQQKECIDFAWDRQSFQRQCVKDFIDNRDVEAACFTKW
jgi:hypothetical protein